MERKTIVKYSRISFDFSGNRGKCNRQGHGAMRQFTVFNKFYLQRT